MRQRLNAHNNSTKSSTLPGFHFDIIPHVFPAFRQFYPYI